jgi:hypothetical protein
MSSTPEEGVRRAQVIYAQSLDDHDIEGLVNVFAPDGKVELRQGAVTGRDAIRQWITGYYAGQPMGRMEKHLMGNALITVNGDTAEAKTDVVVFRCLADAPWRPEAVTRHIDRLALIDGEWLFTSKRIERIAGFERVT